MESWGSRVKFGFACLFVGVLVIAKDALEDRREQTKRSLSLTPRRALLHVESVKRYHFGFKNLMGALIWVRLLQNANTQPVKPGDVSWEFTQLATLSVLDPKFNQVYSFGGIFLSVFRRDNIGAYLLLKRWVEREPNYWRAHYMLGYHLFAEMEDFEQAYPYIFAAAKMERAPGWLTALGIRLLSETGALAQALRLSIELYDQIYEAEYQERLVARIRALNFNLQRRIWNEAVSNFQKNNGRLPQKEEELKRAVFQGKRQLASLVGGVHVSPSLVPILGEVFPFRYDAKLGKVVCTDSTLEKYLSEVGIHERKHSK